MAPKNCILWEIFWTTLSNFFFDKFIEGMEEFVFCGENSGRKKVFWTNLMECMEEIVFCGRNRSHAQHLCFDPGRGRGAHHVDQQVIRGFRNYLFVVFDAVILSLLLMLFLLLFRPGAEVPIRQISRSIHPTQPTYRIEDDLS